MEYAYCIKFHQWTDVYTVYIGSICMYENYDIASTMPSSRAYPVLGHCPGWGYLNIYISVTALAGGI